MSKIHTITVMEDAKELIGKRVRVVYDSTGRNAFTGMEGTYKGCAAIQIVGDTWITEFYWGLQIQEVGDE